MDNGTHTPVAAGMSALAPVPSPPDFLPVPGKPERAWPAWKRAFLMFLEASGLDSVAPSRNKAILFSILGAEGQRIVDAFQLDETPTSEEGDVFEVFLSAIEKHFEFSGCIALER